MKVILKDGMELALLNASGEPVTVQGETRDSLAFTIQAMVYEYDVQAGTYELNTSESSKEIIKILKNAPAEETEAAE